MIAYLLALSIICVPVSEKIEEAVKSYVQANYPIENAEYQYDFRRINWNILPSDFDSVRVFKIGKESPLGNTIFTLGVYDSGKLLKAVPVSIGVTLLADALISKMPINVGEEIHGLMPAKRTITGKGEIPVADSMVFKQTQAKNYIQAGSIMYRSMVEPIPAIIPGDRVEIIYESEAIRVTANGVARQRGGVGEMIKVVNEETKKIIQAEVIDSLTVAVR